jgi:hypothetical protein
LEKSQVGDSPIVFLEVHVTFELPTEDPDGQLPPQVGASVSLTLGSVKAEGTIFQAA